MNQGKRTDQNVVSYKATGVGCIGSILMIVLLLITCSCGTIKEQVSYPNLECERQTKRDMAQDILLRFNHSEEMLHYLDSITSTNTIIK